MKDKKGGFNFDEIFGGDNWGGIPWDSDNSQQEDPYISNQDKSEAYEAARKHGLTDTILVQRFVDTFLKERRTRNMKAKS